MIAVKRLQSLFWVLLVALGALGAYLVSLQVATERNDLMRVRAQVAQARADIRYLETEFSSRANMRQLEKWNADDFRYSAVAANHYLEGERALAHLDGMEPNGPAYTAAPVMVAMVDAGTAASTAPEVTPSPAVLQIRSDANAIRAAQGDVGRAGGRPRQIVNLLALADTPKTAAKAAGNSGGKNMPRSLLPASMKVDRAPQLGAVARKAERMAMLDARLLDDSTLGELGRRAAAENRGKSR